MSVNPLSWTADNLSKGYYADYISPVMVDGAGIRGSLYVSGCPFNCKGCYNKQVQSFTYGKPYTAETTEMIMQDLAQPIMTGITFLGGEPFLNTQVLLPLAEKIKEELPDKTIWAWTGYTYEQLLSLEVSLDKAYLLSTIDVLVDGQFEQDKYRPDLVFRGSWNQRIIDVPKSLQEKKVVLWKDGAYLKNEVHEPIKRNKITPK